MRNVHALNVCTIAAGKQAMKVYVVKNVELNSLKLLNHATCFELNPGKIR